MNNIATNLFNSINYEKHWQLEQYGCLKYYKWFKWFSYNTTLFI